MQPRRRACDRCAELKAQCSEDNPCARCQRLGVDCTQNRPARTRGRPPKSRAAISDATSHDEVPLDEATREAQPAVSHLLLPAAELPIDRNLAVTILDRVLANTHRTALLSPIRRNHHLMDVVKPFDVFISYPSVQCILLAYGILSDPVRHDSETLAENCRIHALADIPILTWKSRPIHRGDIYSLYTLANLSYLDYEATAMADRWAALADCLHGVSTSSPVAHGDFESDELDRRIFSLMKINILVRSLLYNRTVLDESCANSSPDEQHSSWPRIGDNEWHHNSSLEEDSLHSGDVLSVTPEGYFALFMPLQAPLKLALSAPSFDSPAYTAALECLEDYFISFPTSLMDFAKVLMPWQFEAMIWFHGISILLNIGADFILVLLSSQLQKSSTFAHAADHAILLGDVLQGLSDPSFVLHFSPTSIFFIALSATVHSALLSVLSREPLNFDTLTVSAGMHQNVLSVILRDIRTCDHPLIRTSLDILTWTIKSTSQCSTAEIQGHSELIESLKYYRWIAEGSGLIPLSSDIADRLFQDALLQHEGILNMSSLSPLLMSILDPETRISQPGTFDMSILF